MSSRLGRGLARWCRSFWHYRDAGFGCTGSHRTDRLQSCAARSQKTRTSRRVRRNWPTAMAGADEPHRNAPERRQRTDALRSGPSTLARINAGPTGRDLGASVPPRQVVSTWLSSRPAALGAAELLAPCGSGFRVQRQFTLCANRRVSGPPCLRRWAARLPTGGDEELVGEACRPQPDRQGTQSIEPTAWLVCDSRLASQFN